MNASAIRKLRRNFVLIAMLAFISMMAFTGGLINISNSAQTRRTTQDLLDYIIVHEGDFPQSEEEASETAVSVEGVSEAISYDTLESEMPEFQYSTRFYAVLYDRAGRVREVKLNHIHSVDRELALTSAEMIRSLHHPFGGFGQYYFYKKAAYEDGRSIVVVLDASSQIRANQDTTRSTLFICGVGILISFLTVLAVSGRIIRPEIENARRQKMFITNASHELKTPLAVIRANTELEEMLNGENEWTQSTLRQVDRLNGLIQNLVMIARAQETEDADLVRDVDVSTLVLDTVKPYNSLAQQEEKTLEIEISPNLHMTADESRIRQLATILVDNAFKYCDEKGSIFISLSRARLSRQIRFTVSNSYANGKGVDYNRFFERFYREDSSHNSDGNDRGGYGIGLSIAESICGQYKGSIRASWKDGLITFACLLGG